MIFTYFGSSSSLPRIIRRPGHLRCLRLLEVLRELFQGALYFSFGGLVLATMTAATPHP